MEALGHWGLLDCDRLCPLQKLASWYCGPISYQRRSVLASAISSLDLEQSAAIFPAFAALDNGGFVVCCRRNKVSILKVPADWHHNTDELSVRTLQQLPAEFCFCSLACMRDDTVYAELAAIDAEAARAAQHDQVSSNVILTKRQLTWDRAFTHHLERVERIVETAKGRFYSSTYFCALTATREWWGCGASSISGTKPVNVWRKLRLFTTIKPRLHLITISTMSGKAHFRCGRALRVAIRPPDINQNQTEESCIRVNPNRRRL